MGRTLALIAVVAALRCTAAGAGDLKLANRLTVTGSGDLSYRWESSSGSPAGWGLVAGDYLDGSTGLQQRSDLLLAGDILPGLRLDANLVRTPYSDSTSRWTLSGSLGDAALSFGDITASLDGNPFVSLRRSLRGLKIESPLGAGGALTMLSSQAKAPVRSDVFYGRNTSGPYYLTASPVVDASERLELDGRLLKRGRDYFMDYEVGAVWFEASLIVPPTARVAVTYEHAAAGGAGSITAVRATQSRGRLRMGATYAAVRSASAPASALRRDRWAATGGIGPFVLSYRPVVAGSDLVTVNGIEQARDADYQIDYGEGRINFALPPAIGALIDVSYRTQAEASTSAPGSLFGLDAVLQLSQRSSVQASLARSTPGSGTSAGAVALGATAAWDRLIIQANLRSASPDFAGLDGAERMDSERRLSLEYRPASFIRATCLLSATKQPYLGVFGAQQGPVMAQRDQDLRLEMTPRGWPSLILAHTTHSARSASGAESDAGAGENNVSDSASISYARARYGASASFSRSRAQSNWGTALDSSSLTALSYDTASRASRLNLWVRPSDRLSVTMDLGRSLMSTGAEQGSSAGGRRLAVSYQPARALQLTFSDVTQSTQAVQSLSMPASSTRMNAFSLQYTPSARWSASLSADRQSFSGSESTNSDTSSVTVGVGFRPSPIAALDVQLTRQQVASLGASGNSNNNMLGFNAHMGPWRRLTADVGLQRLNGASTGSFLGLYAGTQQYQAAPGRVFSAGQMMPYVMSATESWRGRLAYSLGRRHSVFVEGERWLSSGQTSSGQSESGAAGWEYRLAEGAKLCATLRSMRYRDPGEPRRNWASNTFDLSLGFGL